MDLAERVERVERVAAEVQEARGARAVLVPRAWIIKGEPGPENDDEYGPAGDDVRRWRGMYGEMLDSQTTYRRVKAELAVRRLELRLIQEHRLTLPRSSRPWNEAERRDKVRLLEQAVLRLTGRRRRQEMWRWVW